VQYGLLSRLYYTVVGSDPTNAELRRSVSMLSLPNRPTKLTHSNNLGFIMLQLLLFISDCAPNPEFVTNAPP